MVSWRADDTAEIVRRCLERGVIVRDLPDRGLLRASCGYWTSDEDIDRLVDAL
jgi:selenocysteine lyase/cysteine desulfurase